MDGVQLTAKKLAALVTLSSELDEDAIVEMVDYVANEIAWAMASKEDDCAFNGDGTSTYGGMKGVTQLALDGNHAKAKVTAATGTTPSPCSTAPTSATCSRRSEPRRSRGPPGSSAPSASASA
jgi:HK97 family phage major capsid protein